MRTTYGPEHTGPCAPVSRAVPTPDVCCSLTMILGGCASSSPRSSLSHCQYQLAAATQLPSTAAAQLPALGRRVRRQGQGRTGPRCSFKQENAHGDEAQAPAWTRPPPRQTQPHWGGCAVFGSHSLGARVLHLSVLMPEVPRGWLLPRGSTTLVAMGTVASDTPRPQQSKPAPGLVASTGLHTDSYVSRLSR